MHLIIQVMPSFLHTACHSMCNEGLMRCTGVNSDDCCPYYNDTVCVDDCGDVLEPDADFDCNCTGLFLNPPGCQGTSQQS